MTPHKKAYTSGEFYSFHLPERIKGEASHTSPVS
jgi:hypothetical protein